MLCRLTQGIHAAARRRFQWRVVEKHTRKAYNASMPVFRVLVEKLPCANAVCCAPPDQARHLVRVRRMTRHDQLECLDRSGTACAAEVVELSRDGFSFRLVGTPRPPASVPRVRVCISVLPEDAFDVVLQKCTELGAAECQPLLCEHSVARVRASDAERKCARWQRICDEAAVQSGSAPMRVLPPMPASGVWPVPAPVKLLADQAGDWLPLAPPQSAELVAIAIGPEAGFSDVERAAALQHVWRPVRFSVHTLRAETAAVAACARLIIPTVECSCPSQ